MCDKQSRRGLGGRRALLWAVVLYVVAHAAINAGIDYRLPELRSSYLLSVFNQLRYCSAGGPDVVCLGTSRSGLAFSADEVQEQMRAATGDSQIEVFNASVASQDFITADFIMAEMLARGARPKIAVVEICPEMVHRRNAVLGAHVMPALTSVDLRSYVADLCRAPGNVPGIVADRGYPLFRYRQQAWSAVGQALYDALGEPALKPADAWPRRATLSREAIASNRKAAYSMFLATEAPRARSVAVADELAKMQRWLKNYRIGGMAAHSLEQLLRRCQEHDVTVVLVMPPVASEQRGLYQENVEAPFQAYVRELTATYHCLCVDCRNELPDAYFHDNVHVRIPQGSVPFSKRLAREVLASAWLSRK